MLKNQMWRHIQKTKGVSEIEYKSSLNLSNQKHWI